MCKQASKSESNRRTGEKTEMKFSKLNRVLAAIVFAVLATPLLAARADAGSSLHVRAPLGDNAITALEWTCDPSTGLPNPGDGACIGIETLTGAISGDIEGSYLAEVDFAVLENGEAPFTTFEKFTATIAGHGSGTFTVLEIDDIAPSGVITGKWQIVERSATGDLVGMTGKGQVVGTYDSTTGFASGTLSGVLHFSK